ncbi:oxidative damage protection protein [Flagellatimonas centrodinii]|uniref:oxidative damage protection protein n=1 Tax=Flagellatimonas centrodinii TaxID=2806210 RepID=UPI001FEE9516|nr:oxidative damage protection protein [Flagellatimonas centrodinii]ULQ47671.1 oxidative damage protection protein [Flagellatimonas centrodinii]
MSRTVHCIKLGREAEGLPRPPIPGELGKKLYEQVSQEAWRGWVEHQTRLINEYRLVLSDAKSRRFLMEELEKYFFGGGDLAETGYTPPPSA